LGRKVLVACKLLKLLRDRKNLKSPEEFATSLAAPKLCYHLPLPGELLSQLDRAAFRLPLCAEPPFDLLLVICTPTPVLGETTSAKVLCPEGKPGIVCMRENPISCLRITVR
jgi:hypothetical protein